MLALIYGLTISQFAMYIIAIAAIVAIVGVALKYFGIAIPEFAINIFWILVVAIVCIGAISLVTGML